MGELLGQIGEYWNKRAPSYSDGLFSEREIRVWKDVLRRELPTRQLKILDVGTGPGFFARILAEEGHHVTAVDVTEGMLAFAGKNAGPFRDAISFFRMDAQELRFPEGSFDAVVNRNVTWNLEDPEKAYREWHRVLKPGGMLLVFDAPWYEYLYNPDMARAYEEDRRRTKDAGLVDDSVAYEDSPVMEEISRRLYFSRCSRPGEDLRLLERAGFPSVDVDTGIWKEVWDEDEKIMYASTPMFRIRARK